MPSMEMDWPTAFVIIVIFLTLVGLLDAVIPQDLYVKDFVHGLLVDLAHFAEAVKP